MLVFDERVVVVEVDVPACHVLLVFRLLFAVCPGFFDAVHIFALDGFFFDAFYEVVGDSAGIQPYHERIEDIRSGVVKLQGDIPGPDLSVRRRILCLLLEAAVEVRGAAAQQLAMAAEVLGGAALPDLYGQNCLVKVAVSTSFFSN
jgi:hypothetical protein